MSAQKNIINHLYKLFSFLSEKSSTSIQKGENYKCVFHKSSSWPNFIYDIDLNQINIISLCEKIKNNQLPKHLIITDNQIANHEEKLSSNNFFPIAKWSCLKLEKIKPVKNRKLTIKKITTYLALKEWINAASCGFDTIDIDIFKYCFKDEEIHLFGGYQNNKLVTTALLFYSEDTAGIYHVVTLPQERGKGYATEIFSFCEEVAIKKGANHVIAQATDDGLDLWLKTGMKLYGNFYLFFYNQN